MSGRNFFELGQSEITKADKIVFISYRNVWPDSDDAVKCADEIKKTDGLDIWFDKESKCLQQANNDDFKIAGCIEQGLDVASALLSIIGPKTFTSPWVPYETGGARGRQRFVQPFQDHGVSTRFPPPIRSPLIAHLIKSKEVPQFIKLGTPLYDIEDVKPWAESVVKILDMIKMGYSGHALLEKVYRPNTPENIRYLRWSEILGEYMNG